MDGDLESQPDWDPDDYYSSQIEAASDQFAGFASLPDVDAESVEHRLNAEVHLQKYHDRAEPAEPAEPATVARAKPNNLARFEAELPAGLHATPTFAARP